METVNTVDVGGAIYSEYDYTMVAAAKLTKSFTFKGKSFEMGEVFNGLVVDGQKAYCPNYSTYGGVYLCLSDSGGNGSFDKVNDFGALSGWKKLDSPVPYSKTVSTIEGGKGFKMQLLYQGIVGNGISVSYREYQNSMARPAYTQEVKYELDSSGRTMIGFKGARIEVLNATNIEVQYRVKQGFSKQ